MPLQAVFFDLDDTLLDDTESLDACAIEAAATVAADTGVDPQVLGYAYVEAAVDFWVSLAPGSPRPAPGDIRPSMWAAALERVGIEDLSLASSLARRFDELRVERTELFPDALETLQALHRRFKMAIITNGFAETHDAKLARLEIGRFFDAIVLAGEIGTVKPDPEVFHHAMSLLDVAPSVSVMVGDRYDRDIAGAHAAGMRAIWMNVRNEEVPRGARRPEAVIFRIKDLPSALDSLGGDGTDVK